MVTSELRVMILEDDQDHARLLELQLQRIPDVAFRVTCCETSDEAIESLRSQRFDVLLLDYWLESGTCEPVLSSLRRDPAVPAVIVTTSANDEYVAATVSRAGAHRYVRKLDLSASFLQEAIRGAIADSERSREAGQAADFARRRLAKLTPREREVAYLIGQGFLSKQIAVELGCAEGTVNLHRSHIMAKTRARGVADLIRMVLLAEDAVSDAELN